MLRMMRSRKAQAVMEYLHTYGWVFLTVVILGGSLLYYNATHSESLLPKECTFLSGIRCMDGVAEESMLTISVLNEFGFDISNISVNIIGTCNSTANTSDGNMYSNPNVLLSNQQHTFIMDCQNLTGLKVSEKIIFNYTSVQSGESHIKVGKMEYWPTES